MAIDTYVRSFRLWAADLHEHTDRIHTVMHEDRTENSFYPPVASPEYLAAVDEMGYTDPMRYAVEHEIAHHIVAQARGQSHSRIIWNACHSIPQSMDEYASRSEEHLVNRLQRFVNTGAADPYGELDRVLGKSLVWAAQKLVCIGRPWLVL